MQLFLNKNISKMVFGVACAFFAVIFILFLVEMKKNVRKSYCKPNTLAFGKQSRKDKRKDERKMVKIRKMANCMKKPVADVINHYYTPVNVQERDVKHAEQKPRTSNPHIEEEEEILSDPEPNLADEDERAQKFYARKLGMHKRKKKGLPKIFAESGLDYILEVCDMQKTATEVEARKEYAGRKDRQTNETETEVKNQELMEEGQSSSEQHQAQDEQVGEQEREDLYGRVDGKVDDDLTNKRVQFLERMQKQDESSESLDKMRKQMRGLINRLSEGTLISSVKLIQATYSTHKHNDVKSCLSECLLKSLCVPALLPHRLTMEYAALVAAIHTLVSPQISGHVVEDMAHRFREYLDYETLDVDDKSCNNLVIFICSLLNCKVIESNLVLEMLNELKERFTERCISLILLIMTHAGFALRKSNPMGLKDFILEIQSKAEGDQALSKEKSNVRFMLETVAAVKNNNMLKVVAYDHSLVEHFNKLIKAITKGHAMEDALPMGLHDLWQADVKGRWWVVGSVWNPATSGPLQDKPKEPSKQALNFSSDMLQMAKKHRMNTQLRINIFCTIMTSQDCEDCVYKLVKLGLKGTKEREIIHVTVTCALKQKSYNHFYTVLLQKLCTRQKRFRLTTQYALWDRMKEVDLLKKVQQKNLASLIANLLIVETVNLSVFKVIRFAQLDSHASTLLRRIFRIFLTKISSEKLKTMCSLTIASPKNALVVEGLQLFMQYAFLKKNLAGQLQENAHHFYEYLAPKHISAL